MIGNSFYDLTTQYPDEASAERYFEQRRWPAGTRCPKCKSSNVTRGTQAKRKRKLWYCNQCDNQFSVTSGTIMDSTKMDGKRLRLYKPKKGAGKSLLPRKAGERKPDYIEPGSDDDGAGNGR